MPTSAAGAFVAGRAVQNAWLVSVVVEPPPAGLLPGAAVWAGKGEGSRAWRSDGGMAVAGGRGQWHRGAGLARGGGRALDSPEGSLIKHVANTKVLPWEKLVGAKWAEA